MEGGGGGRGGGGGGVLGAAREARAEEERGRGGGAMGRARVHARVRAPHGAGALLIVGGAIVGAAVLAWLRRHHGGGEGAKNRGEEHTKEEEVLGGGVADDEQGEEQKLRQIYENLSRDNIEVGVNGSGGKAAEEPQQIQKNGEIVKSDLVSEPVEKYDHNSDGDCAKITADGMDTGNATEDDDNSSKNGSEDDDEYSSKNTVENEDTEGVDNSDGSTLCLSGPDIAVEERDNHYGVAQDTEPTETASTTEGATHQEKSSKEMKIDTVAKTVEVKLAVNTVAETVEVKLAEGDTVAEIAEVKMAKGDTVAEEAEVKLTEAAVMEENEFEQEEEKAKGELVEPVGLPAYSIPSLLKRTEKKRMANPGWNERGMKLEQDCTNGELNEHELTKGRDALGGAVLTMDRRTTSVAILALMFAVTIGITIFIRLSVPLQAA